MTFVTAADSLKASERRLVAQSDALTELTARYTNPSEQFDDRLRSILEISARALHVERLSMWRVRRRSARSSAAWACIAAPATSTNPDPCCIAHDCPALLRRHRARARRRGRRRPDRSAHARVPRRAISIPNGIGAMLDVPLRHDNTPVGVLCAEHVGGAQAWTVDEQNFAHLGRQPHRRRHRRGGAAARRSPAWRKARRGRG